MGYEIDFLSVGTGEKCGDAIGIRFGNLYGERDEQTVVVIDGGFKETGEELVKHIKKYYLTDYVDLVVSTHPDADHSAGLSVVLEKLKVHCLWMHLPWQHTDDIASMFKDGKVTNDSISERLRKALDDARNLEKLANSKNIPIIEPFTGIQDESAHIEVIGPSEDYYEELLIDFRSTPEPRVEGSFLTRTIEAGVGLMTRVAESLDIETLDDSGETSAENNSSTILQVKVEDQKMLFTGDTGIPALTYAADYLEDCGEEPSGWRFIQVPHHGSKRNVGPTILDRLIGLKLNPYHEKVTAFVSAPKNGLPKHPAKKVTNAFRRRGAPVCARRNTMRESKDAPDREGWVPIEPLPLYDEVDE